MNNAKLQELNTRLKRGEGWIGYRTSKGSNGEKLPSKFLYFAFYQGSQQKFVNCKTNDPEDAYRQLPDARRATTEGVRLLPCEVSRIRYEDLRTILLDYYREHKPRSIIFASCANLSRNHQCEFWQFSTALRSHPFQRLASGTAPQSCPVAPSPLSLHPC